MDRIMTPCGVAIDNSPRSVRLGRLAPAACVLALAGIVRFEDLGREPLWLDEATTLWTATSDAPLLDAAAADNQGPAGALLVRACVAIGGATPSMVRLPSALAGFACVAVVLALAWRRVSPTAGLLTG